MPNDHVLNVDTQSAEDRSRLILDTLTRTGRLSVDELKTEAKDAGASQRIYAEMVSESCGGKISAKKVEELMLKETTLTASQAVKLGFAHSILN